MRRRKRKKNPAGLLLAVGALGLVGGGVAVAVLRKPPITVLPNGIQFDPSAPGKLASGTFPDDQFAGLIPTDFLEVDVTKLPFAIAGVSNGKALFQATAAPNVAAHSIVAVLRAPSIDNTLRTIPQAALLGAAAAT